MTVRRGEANPLAWVRLQLEANPELLSEGPEAVLHAVMDSIVDNYVRIDSEVASDLDEIEEAVFAGTRHVDSRSARSTGSSARCWSSSAPTVLLATPLVASCTARARRTRLWARPRKCRLRFRDVADHLQTWSSTTSRPMTACWPTCSVPTSPRWRFSRTSDMRKISAWVAIAAVPTMVAGIYGMNFEFMPELSASVTIGDTEFHWGYFAILAVILASTTALFLFFRRHHWL